jgi:hypothetical protein
MSRHDDQQHARHLDHLVVQPAQIRARGLDIGDRQVLSRSGRQQGDCLLIGLSRGDIRVNFPASS